jgi:Glycosyl transferase family 2
MNLVGMMCARNEQWVLGFSARAALEWCDSLIIFDHASTDKTPEIIRQLRGQLRSKSGKSRIYYARVEETQWNEMQHRQYMLNVARAEWAEIATHLAIIDSDEVLTANLIGGIRDQIQSLRAGQMMTLPLYNLRGGMNRYHLNGVWGQRIVSVAFKDVNTISWRGDKFHSREPEGVQWQSIRMVNQGAGGVMHLWGASERRLIAKHALYKCTETLRWPDKDRDTIDREYSMAIKGRPWIGDTPEKWTYADVPANWLAPYTDLMIDHLHLDDEPWQEAEVRRLVADHGRGRFAGLDLFGIA